MRMKLIRYRNDQGQPVLAAVYEEKAYPLPWKDVVEVVREASAQNAAPSEFVKRQLAGVRPLDEPLDRLELLVPVEAPEVWAAGVTYEKSREARNYEATRGRLDARTFYDKVYDAERPELFMKSTAARTVGPGQPVYIRSDSKWQIPEPELALVLTKEGSIIGYTAGNDMSCRDIEGDNPLYLPQAKIWKRSCAIGPAVLLADAAENPYGLEIACRIYRAGGLVFEGSANTRQLKRRLEELVEFLRRDNELFDGTVLLTGTCIVPPNEFTLQAGDRVEIEIAGIGTLINPVQQASA
jgi:2-dehydro-3-deoxy-D-arabinonate dehydratase